MGKVVCETHGSHGGAMVSPAVAHAVLENERWPAHALVRIHLDFEVDREPLSPVWLDRATAGDRDEQRVVFDEHLNFTIVCRECLAAWLLANGVDN